MGQTFDRNDMLFHMLVVGGTGSGKTNAILYMLNLLFNKKEEGTPQPGLFLFDPAGDASMDLLRAIPKSEWNRTVILDPQYVTFGFNLLSLPESLEPGEKPQVIHTQVDEFSVLLSDAFNTDAASAPRLMWIFKGALYYLYRFTSDPTFWELYSIMLDFTRRSSKEIEDLLKRKEVEKDIIQGTMEAISKLPQDAYMPVLNRISNFVLPQSSITFRTFCNRKSTIDLEKRMESGMLTIFRIPPDLPNDFRRIFASAVVMRLYFASLKRARRLERSGQPPTARTPVVFAADEFRDIAQLKILRTILSQSRKFGLYLWMVVQVLSDVPEEMTGSVLANVGPILSFRSSSDDAKTLSRILHPQRAEAVAQLIPGLEDYAALVRKRPVGGKPLEPPLRVTFPKLREPVHGYADALDYMKFDMEERYGGATGDRDLIYKTELEQAMKEKGECYLGEPQLWVPLAYLHCHGEMGFKPMSKIFEDRYGWEKKVLQLGLNRLGESGRVADRPVAGQLFVEIDPETKQPRYKEPETDDERRSARDILYKITPAAEEELFEFKLESLERAGGPLHIKVMRALLEEYWERGYWCAWDRGSGSKPLPDVLVTPPLIIRVKGKEGKPAIYLDPDKWDEGKKAAVEVETNPSKNFGQLRLNYEKNAPKYSKVRFVVPSIDLVPEVRRILQDKDKTKFEVVYKDVGLPKDEVERLVAEEEAAKTKANENHGEETETRTEKWRSPSSLQKKELWILAKVCILGYRGRAELASALRVSDRQVTRYLDTLEMSGLLKRDGNGYRPMEAGSRLVAEAGWTSSTLPKTADELKLDMSTLRVKDEGGHQE